MVNLNKNNGKVGGITRASGRNVSYSNVEYRGEVVAACYHCITTVIDPWVNVSVTI